MTKALNETEAGHIADHAEADSEKQDIPHEWPYSSEQFEAFGSKT